MSFLAYLLAVTCGAVAWSITENLARKRERQKEHAELEDRRRELQVEVELRGRQADAFARYLQEDKGLGTICERCGLKRSWRTGCPIHPHETLRFVAIQAPSDDSPFRSRARSEMSLATARRFCERQDRPCRDIPGIALEQLCGTCEWNAGPIGPSGTIGPGGPGKAAA